MSLPKQKVRWGQYLVQQVDDFVEQIDTFLRVDFCFVEHAMRFRGRWRTLLSLGLERSLIAEYIRLCTLEN